MKRIFPAVLIPVTMLLFSCNGSSSSAGNGSNDDSASMGTDSSRSQMTSNTNGSADGKMTDQAGTTTGGSQSGAGAGNQAGTGAGNQPGSSSTGAGSMNQAGSGKPVTDKSVMAFVSKAVPGGMMEVEMGNMAANQSQNPRVKAFGNMLVTDHTAAGNELKSMAMSNSITVPTALPAEQRSHMDMLKNKKGNDFDKAYMDMMIADHKKDINEYKNASTSLSEATYKAFATKTLPVLQKHLDSAQAIRKSM